MYRSYINEGKNCKDYSDRSNDLQNRKCKSWAIANQKEWKGVVDNSSLDTGCVLLDNDEVYYNTNQNTNNNNKSICDERTVVSRETGITYACTGYKYFGIQATKPSPFYKKIAIDNDCSRTEELPGTFDSLLSCANKANEVNKGKYFI